MMTEDEAARHLRKLGVTDEGIRLVMNIRSLPPERSADGSAVSVGTRFPSKKMGFAQEQDSHKVELPFVYLLENDPNVLEYYCQPFGKIKLAFAAKNGRQIGVLHTPDVFVIHRDWAGWRECKAEMRLRALAIDHPNRYLRASEGG